MISAYNNAIQLIREWHGMGMKKDKEEKNVREDKSTFNGNVDLPPETPNFQFIHDRDVIRKLFKEAKIKVPLDSSIYAWTFKDKFIFGQWMSVERDGNWVSEYKWFVLNRKNMEIIDCFFSPKTKRYFSSI